MNGYDSEGEELPPLPDETELLDEIDKLKIVDNKNNQNKSKKTVPPKQVENSQRY